MSAMLVEMILKLVDNFSSGMKAPERELERFEQTAKKASLASDKINGKSLYDAGVRAKEATREVELFEAAVKQAAGASGTLAARDYQALMQRRPQLAQEYAQAEKEAADAAKRAKQEAREHEAAARDMRGHYAGMAKDMLGMVAAFETLKLAKEAWKAGADAMHTDINMQTQGLTAANREEIHKSAAGLSQTYKLFNQTDIENIISEVIPILGDTHHALKSLPAALQAATIIRARDPKGDWEHSVNAIFNGLELAGYQKSNEKFEHTLDLVMKGTNAFGKRLTLEKYGQFLAGAGASAKGFNDEFFLRSLPTFLNEVNDGFSAGQQLATLSAMVHKGGGSGRQSQALRDAGMIDPAHIIYTQKGNYAGFSAGGIIGGDIFNQDPTRWISDVLVPKLQKMGKSEQEIDDTLYTIFQNRNAHRFAYKSKEQQDVLDRDYARSSVAPGLDAWKTWMTDASTAWASAGAKFEDSMRLASEPLQGISATLGTIAASLLAANNRTVEKTPLLGPIEGAGVLAGGAWLAGKFMGFLKGWALKGTGLGGAAETSGAVASTEVAAATIGSRIAPIVSRFLGPLGIAYGLYEASNHPVEAGDREDREKGLADLTRRWGVRPDQATRRATSGMDTGEMDEARRKADETGQAIVSSLSVTARPTVDKSDLREVEAILDRIAGRLAGLGTGFAGLTAGANRLRTSAGALHDGPETGGR